MRPVIIHYDFFHSGGECIIDGLKAAFGTGWMSIPDPTGHHLLNESDLEALLERNPRLKVVSSRSLMPLLPRQVTCFPIVMIRHPIERLMAVHEAWSTGGNAPAGFDPTWGLKEFSSWILQRSPETLAVRNAQTIRYSASAFLRIREANAPHEGTNEDLLEAKSFLSSLPVVGIADCIEASRTAICAAAPSGLSIAWGPHHPPSQGQPTVPLPDRLGQLEREVGEVIYRGLSEANALDLALYEQGCAILANKSSGQKDKDILVFTGERFMPDSKGFGPDTAAEHILRYRAVADLAAGRRVLDVASGEGYGTALLASRAATADGIDISPAAVSHAQTVYKGIRNCRFHQGSVEKLPFPDEHFDLVVSFETIEHIDNKTQHAFIAEVHRVLKPDGILIISSPNRRNYSERRGIVNPFHIREMDEREFKDVLSPMRVFRLYRQGIMAFPAIWDAAAAPSFSLHGELRQNEVDDLFFIAVCGRERSMEPSLSLNALCYEPALSYTVMEDALLEKERLIQTTSAWALELKGNLEGLLKERDHARLALESQKVEVQRMTALLEGKERLNQESSERTLQLKHAAEALRVERDQAIRLQESQGIEIAKLTASLDEMSRHGHLDRERIEEQDRKLHVGDALIQELNQQLKGYETDATSHHALGSNSQERASESQATIFHLEETIRERDARLIELGDWGQQCHRIIEERDTTIRNLTASLAELSRWSQGLQSQRAMIEMSIAALIQPCAHLREILKDIAEDEPASVPGRDLSVSGPAVPDLEGIAGRDRSPSLHLMDKCAATLAKAIAYIASHKIGRESVEAAIGTAGFDGLSNDLREQFISQFNALRKQSIQEEARRVELAKQLEETERMHQRSRQEVLHSNHLIHEKEAAIHRAGAEITRLQAESMRLQDNLREIERGSGYRLLASYWGVRDAMFPTGTRRRALAKGSIALVRHPLKGSLCLMRGDIGWLAHGLDWGWFRERQTRNPYAPRTWTGWLAPIGTRRRMLVEMILGVVASPIRLFCAQPIKKWKTALSLLRKGNIAEMWMRFHQVRGEELRRNPVAPVGQKAPVHGSGRHLISESGPMPSLPGAPADGRVEVSIIIPVHNHWALTNACLRSIARYPAAVSCEIILVDDASGDETAERVKTIGNLHCIRSETNIGFLRSCNLAAGQARGRWICLLNNDTIVIKGWLDELVDTMRRNQRIGAVGSKLLFPDGRLQEAGGIIWNDASATNFGMHGDPNAPQYSYAREVDYSSAACLLVDAELFRSLGWFDERYAPAFYEDTDLAFRIREKGRTIVYQPCSEIFHHGGSSCGTDPAKGIKGFQVRNQAIFAERWCSELKAYRPPGSLAEGGSGRIRAIRRVLVIDQRLPTPDRDAGSSFLIALMGTFSSLGYHVCFAALESSPLDSAEALALKRIGIEVAGQPYVMSVKSLLMSRGGEFDIIAMVRYHVAQRVLGDIACYGGTAKRLLIPADLHWLRNLREAELVGDVSSKSRIMREKEVEMEVVSASSATIVHSSHERSLILEHSPKTVVSLLPWIADVVDNAGSAGARKGVSFIGGFAHRPNVDAAIYLANEIWPLVRIQSPGALLSIIGADPPPHVQALAQADIRILGHVPALDEHLAGERVTIAPLRWGAGFKGKIATSISNGVPVVATPVAAEGMGLTHDSEIHIAADPGALAAAVVSLITDDVKWTRMSLACLAFARRNWSRQAACDRLVELLSRLGISPTHEISDRIQAVTLSSPKGSSHV